MTSQGTRPRGRSSHTRGTSEPQSSLAQARQRRTPMNDGIFPSVPTMTGSAPLTHNRTQTIFPSSHEAIPHTSQATVSTVPHPFLLGPELLHQLQVHHRQFLPQSVQLHLALFSLKIVLMLYSSLSKKLWDNHSLVETTSTEGLDETPGLLGYQCWLCNRDLNLTPGNQPISQSNLRPGHAVLACGHTFHDECLKKETPEDQKHDPPCIPCAIIPRE
ncbi:hypothetical protein K1719_042126 [Acacia pycnantha]|nr:hypothetical protein K1719_042126 [Acacia pycnantha]